MQHPDTVATATDPATDPAAMLRDLFDALVRGSLERIEAERTEAERNKGVEDTRNGPLLLSRKKAIEYLGLSPSTFDRLNSAAAINHVLIGARKMYRPSDLDEYVSNLERKS